jgi:integrase
MPGSPYWWYRWTENGKRYAVSLKTADEALAVAKKTEILADVQRRGSEAYRTVKSDSGTASIGAAAVVDRYLDEAKSRTRKAMRPETAKTVGFVLKRFLSDSAVIDIRQLTTGIMQTWLRTQKANGRASETLRSYNRDLKAWQTWLRKSALVRADRLPDLEQYDKPPTGRKNWLDQTKADAIIAAAADDTDLQFVLHCGFNAGLRRAEISEARVEWFDLERGVVDVSSGFGWTTKDTDARPIPLKAPFREFLVTYLAGRTPGYVLAPDVVKGKSRYRYDCNRRVKSHFATCGVRCSWHDMRRSFASNLVSRGESIYIVAKWLGDGIAVTERSYGHIAPSSGNIDRL